MFEQQRAGFDGMSLSRAWTFVPTAESAAADLDVTRGHPGAPDA
jgi:hypothetical protein